MAGKAAVPKPEKPLTAGEVRAAIWRSYPPPRYATLFEVVNATGAQHTRSADAVVMSCWPSMALELHGMEVKISRADWMRERAKPEKAEPIAAYCDRWSLVTGPNVVIDISEIPQAWGWMIFNGKGLQTRREPAKNDAVKPLDRLFLAALLRRAGKTDDSRVASIVEEKTASIRADVDAEVQRRVDTRSRDYSSLVKIVTEFEQATGIDLSDQGSFGFLRSGTGKQIGQMIKAIRESGLAATWTGLDGLETHLDKALEQIGKLRSAMGIGKGETLAEMAATIKRKKK